MTLAGEFYERLRNWSDIQGHLHYLQEQTCTYTNPVIIELGTRTGQSTIAFLTGIEMVGGELWSVDINPPTVPDHWFDIPHWNFLQADDMSAEADNWLPNTADILFLDTSHTYNHTLAELELYVPRVKSGGICFFHDTQFAPPGHDLGEPIGEVARALNNYCSKIGLTWENRAGFYGLGILKVG